MKKTICAVMLCAALVLSGCRTQTGISNISTDPAATVPEDAAPYRETPDLSAVAASMEDTELTNEELQFWYWAEVNQYRRSGASPAPDFDRPLDTQPCEADQSAGSWQQFFLHAALERWHTAAALIRHSREYPLPTEDAYAGDPEILEKYMGQMPAAKLLYGFDPYYHPNSLHQSYLEDLENRFQGTRLEAVRTLNYAYMYFTTLTYSLPEPEAAASGGSEPLVSFRHILLLPREGQAMGDCIAEATELLTRWMADKNAGADSFAQLACRYSQDPGTGKNGGLYRDLGLEQLPPELARWCFEDGRQEGDTTVIPGEDAVHILYFMEKQDASAITTADQARTDARQELLRSIREQYPMQVDQQKIAVTESGPEESLSELLYPDITHERFPEVPLYLQQDYGSTMYGEYKLRTNGCGITSLAMLASYMTDEELTPPQLCRRYGRYSRPTGTSGSLFEEAPPQLGFYLIKKSYDWREARDYMQEGYPVIVVQHKGYWTSGGHYLVLEKLTEDGMVQVRDSNMFNYRKLLRHKDDKFPWDTLQSGGKGYWIYEKKVTACPACVRCGDPETLMQRVVSDYLCEKCRIALIRRNAYLALS